MNMIVNHQMILSEGNKVSTEKDNTNSGNNINDIMSDLSDIVFKMVMLFKKMRDMLNTYNQKQQELGWNIQVASMQNKRDAIDKTAIGAITSGVCTILSGVASGVGAVASLKVGDIATHGGSALGQLGSGSGKLVEGSSTREADSLRMNGDLQYSNAQSYNKNISELRDNTNELRQSIKDLTVAVNNIQSQISMAVKL